MRLLVKIDSIQDNFEKTLKPSIDPNRQELNTSLLAKKRAPLDEIKVTFLLSDLSFKT